MYETEAKEMAYQNFQASGAIRNAQYANTAVQGINPPKLSTVTDEIIGRLENIHSVLRNVADGQKMLIDRLHGPCPEPTGGECKSPIAPGKLQTIDERLNWLLSIAQNISENQQRLDRLA